MENFDNETMNSPQPAPQQPVFMPPVETEFQQPAPAAEQPVFTPPVAEQPVFTAPVQQSGYAPSPEQVAYTQPDAPKTKKKKERKDPIGWKAAVCVLLVLGLVFSTAWFMGSYYNHRLNELQADYDDRLASLEGKVAGLQNRPGTSSSGSTQAPSVQPPSGDLLTPAQVYAQNVPSVVMIKNVIKGSYFSNGGTSTGSGFVISSDGYVVTNYHVVEGGGSLSVVLYDGTEYAATMVGYDNANDVALLKAEAQGLQAVTLGDSDALVVGDQVAAIGNPLGELTSTMTVGYVSAKERDVNTSGFAINMIQTDAAINSGNSGGPLFNMYGQVVGITSAKYSGSSSSGATIEGIGFAIPLNDVLPLLQDLMTNGRDTGPYLGISVKDMDAESADYFGLPMGAYVSEVVVGSCAEKAGLQAKDIITGLGEQTVGSVNDLTRALRKFRAGDTVQMTVSRGGQALTLTVVLDEKPEQTEEVIPQQMPNQNDWSQAIPDEWSQMIPGFGG